MAMKEKQSGLFTQQVKSIIIMHANVSSFVYSLGKWFTTISFIYLLKNMLWVFLSACHYGSSMTKKVRLKDQRSYCINSVLRNELIDACH